MAKALVWFVISLLPKTNNTNTFFVMYDIFGSMTLLLEIGERRFAKK